MCDLKLVSCLASVYHLLFEASGDFELQDSCLSSECGGMFNCAEAEETEMIRIREMS